MYFYAYIENIGFWVKDKSMYISIAIFFGTIYLSYKNKKPDHKINSILNDRK